MLMPRSVWTLLCAALVAGVLSVGTATTATASVARAESKACSKNNAVPFVPVSVSIAGIGKVSVVGRGRTKAGVPKSLPLTDSGKRKFAWDRGGVMPGSLSRHVLLNAHVWTDGSGIGDELNTSLKRKMILKVRGAAGQVQCYQVKKRKIGPNGKRLAKIYYGNATSKPRLAIVTCTGVRRGPGDWSKRSVWLAKPIR